MTDKAAKPEKEKEKIISEEDDALAKEKEEERLRLEKERELLIAKYKRYVDTITIREKQLEELKKIWNDYLKFIYKYKDDFREQLWWTRYLYEPTRRNCLIVKEINTFISLWDKSMRSLRAVDIQIGTGLDLIRDIYYTEYLYPNVEEVVRRNWCEQITIIENLIEENLRMSTFKVLKYASNILDIKTGNLQYQNVQPNSSLLLWWNVSKNPKYRSFEFHLAGLNFELPKPMVGLECVMQFRYSKFDHFSHYCQTFNTKTPPFCEPPEEFEDPTLKPMSATDSAVDSLLYSVPVPVEPPPVEEVVKTESSKQFFSPRKPAMCPLEVTVGPGDTCEMSLTIERAEHEDVDVEEGLMPGEVNLRDYTVLGGVWHPKVLTVPPQPIKIEKWRLIEDIPPVLKEFPYEFQYVPPRGSVTFAEDDPEAEQEMANQKYELEKLLFVELKLDFEKIIWMEGQTPPVLARWDDEYQCWTTVGIYDTKYDEEETMYSFRLGLFAPFALLQKKFLNFPYQSWLLQPIDKNNVKLTIQTAIVTIEFQIWDENTALIQCVYNELPCLEFLYNKFMPSKLLLRELKLYGVNFFPEHDAYKYIEPGIRMKDWNLEVEIYKSIALTCSAYEFGSSRWNGTVGTRRSIIKLREQITPKIKGPQYLVHCHLQDTFVLQIVEQSQEFLETPAPDQEYYVNLYSMVLLAGSTEAKELVKNCPMPLIDGVFNTLMCTKPISFCQ